MKATGKDYVIGKGKVYFDQFKPGTKIGTGERYFGNTPELTTSADAETLDHYDADEGLNVKDESITTANNLTGSLITDNISPENLALFFAGPINKLTSTSQVGAISTTIVNKGRFFQLGVSELTPTGARNITNVVANKVSPGLLPTDPPIVTPVTLLGNIEVDLERGRVYVELDAPDLLDGDTVEFTFDTEASTRTVVIGRGDEIRGSLRFISANPVGSQKDYYWPYVKLTPNGDYALKGEEWMQLGFSFEVLKRDGSSERVYVDIR